MCVCVRVLSVVRASARTPARGRRRKTERLASITAFRVELGGRDDREWRTANTTTHRWEEDLSSCSLPNPSVFSLAMFLRSSASLLQRARPAHGGAPAALTRAYRRHRAPSLYSADENAWYGQQLRATTILSVRKDDKVFLIGDGQVSLGSQVIKPNARKVRQLKEGVICGFAGATADAMTLFERLEMKLQEHPETMRACVEMAKAWRMDKYLRRLEAIMIVCDKNVSLTLTGTGDVIEPEDGIIGIGSGGQFATAAARALLDVDGMDAPTIGRKAMKIAGDMCVYTNHNFIEMEIDTTPTDADSGDSAAK